MIFTTDAQLQMLISIIIATMSLATTIITWQIKKSDKKAEKREKARQESEILTQKGLRVTGALAYISGRKQIDGDHEKELEEALKNYDDYIKENADFTHRLKADLIQGQ